MRFTEIPSEVRLQIYNRDSIDDWVCCIYCGDPGGVEVHHYIERSRGGMGIPENLVCLCPKCHRLAHEENKEVKQFAKEYLQAHYEDWSEEKLIVKKGIDK